MVLFEDPMGQIAVAAGVVLEIIGYFVIMKMVDIEL
jgi:Flp pilus assembly protein TadB